MTTKRRRFSVDPLQTLIDGPLRQTDLSCSQGTGRALIRTKPESGLAASSRVGCSSSGIKAPRIVSLSIIGVSTVAGLTVFTLMNCGPNSAANVFIRATTPAFEAL